MRVKIPNKNEKGNGLLITMILILVMMIIVVGALGIASLQTDITNIEKETSNASTLVESVIEKVVNDLNKEVEIATYDIMKEVEKVTLKEVKNQISSINSSPNTSNVYSPLNRYLKYKMFGSGAAATYKITFASATDPKKVEDTILKQLREKILLKDPASGSFLPRKIEYVVNSDYTFDVNNRGKDGDQTKVTVTISEGEDLDKYEVYAVAQVINSAGDVIESQQSAKAVIEINMPPSVETYFSEKYAWFDENNPAEVLSGAIISYSPIVLNTGTLNVFNGDMKVTGQKMPKNSLTTVDNNRVFEAPKYRDGVTVKRGAILEVHGNLYTISNLASIGGSIAVHGDVVADSVAIYDNFYFENRPDDIMGSGMYNEPWNHRVTGANIFIGKNAYVDNDVFIEKYTDNCTITVGNTIFGIMNGDRTNTNIAKTTLQDGTVVDVVDPNMSSGVFNMGENSIIRARNIFVHGQPYINFHDGKGYHALFESIGEPYEDVYSLDKYREEMFGETNDYLFIEPYRSSIKRDKIMITQDDGKIYAPQYASYVSPLVPDGETQPRKDVFYNDADALKFFYRGLNNLPTEFTGTDYDLVQYKGPTGEVIYSEDGCELYYAAIPDKFIGMKDFYAKKMLSGDAPTTKYNGAQYFGGLRAIMTAKRSPLYGAYNTTTRDFDILEFDQIVHLDTLGTDPHFWTVANPLVLTNGGTLNIEDYYVNGEPYPSIIISRGDLTLTTNSALKNKFKGIIICKGKLTVDQNIDVEGSIVLGGGLEITSTNTLNVTYNKNMIFETNFANRELFRKILDTLHITNFKDSTNPLNVDTYGDMAAALNAYKYNETGANKLPYSYTLPRIKLSNDLHVTVETDTIVVKVKEMKKLKN